MVNCLEVKRRQIGSGDDSIGEGVRGHERREELVRAGRHPRGQRDLDEARERHAGSLENLLHRCWATGGRRSPPSPGLLKKAIWLSGQEQADVEIERHVGRSVVHGEADGEDVAGVQRLATFVDTWTAARPAALPAAVLLIVRSTTFPEGGSSPIERDLSDGRAGSRPR